MSKLKISAHLPFSCEEWHQYLRQVPQLIAENSYTKQLSAGKTPCYLLETNVSPSHTKLVVKHFPANNTVKRWFDSQLKNGTPPQRHWSIANALWQLNKTTPMPVALIDDPRSHQSYLITRYESNSSLKQEIDHILQTTQSSDELVSLLKYVIEQIRKLHHAGYIHGDLGNQNILLNRTATGWTDIGFIDLNRCRRHPAPTLKQRAKDLDRLEFPSFFLHVIEYMYWEDQEPPRAFTRHLKKYRSRFRRHQQSHRWRHPIRWYRSRSKRRAESQQQITDKNLWLWDEKSAQAMITLSTKDKYKNRHYAEYLSIIRELARYYAKIKRQHQQLLPTSFNTPVSMSQKIGMTLHPHSDYIETELRLLEELDCTAVLVRFNYHEDKTQWERTIRLIGDLHERGIQVSIALLQTRNAILDPNGWASFIQHIIPRIHNRIEWIEVGHAINRLKWGIWQIKEYLGLYQPLIALQQTYPDLKLVGPAIIDFNWAELIHALGMVTQHCNLYATSSHLYVDRRGAPENQQNGYSTLEKCALFKAAANTFPNCQNRFIVTEVNWPLQDTGEYSPILCPYVTPSKRASRPGVNETDYAHFMIRYIAIALCSGHVDSIYWWRLSAHGYGLVDDLDNWRKRPAFYALKTLLHRLGQATFLRRIKSTQDDFLLLFDTAQGKELLAWTTQDDKTITLPFSISQHRDGHGKLMSERYSADIRISQEPNYFTVNDASL